MYNQSLCPECDLRSKNNSSVKDTKASPRLYHTTSKLQLRSEVTVLSTCWVILVSLVRNPDIAGS